MKINRISRETYVIVFLILIIINAFVYQCTYEELKSYKDLNYLYVGFMIILNLFLKIKRLNDINLSGWYAYLTFVPILNLALLALFFIDGTKGKNKYGDDPKGRVSEKNKLKRLNGLISEIDHKIHILHDSLNSGVIDKTVFDKKLEKLNTDKQEINDEYETIEKIKLYAEEEKKLKILLENKILEKKEYEEKLVSLKAKYGLKEYIHLDTKLFYISSGREFGPLQAKEIIRLMNIKKINPNCLVKLESENNYGTRRLYDIAKLFE